MPWILLTLAGALEIAWVIGLKHSEGFTRPLPTAFTLGAALLSLALLAAAARSLPLGTAYAAWTGIGVGGTVLAGIFLLGESVSIPQALCLALILLGVIGLKLLGPGAV